MGYVAQCTIVTSIRRSNYYNANSMVYIRQARRTTVESRLQKPNFANANSLYFMHNVIWAFSLFTVLLLTKLGFMKRDGVGIFKRSRTKSLANWRFLHLILINKRSCRWRSGCMSSLKFYIFQGIVKFCCFLWESESFDSIIIWGSEKTEDIAIH